MENKAEPEMEQGLYSGVYGTLACVRSACAVQSQLSFCLTETLADLNHSDGSHRQTSQIGLNNCFQNWEIS